MYTRKNNLALFAETTWKKLVFWKMVGAHDAER